MADGKGYYNKNTKIVYPTKKILHLDAAIKLNINR